jgi:polar amino acid transport system substrate-binding protein
LLILALVAVCHADAHDNLKVTLTQQEYPPLIMREAPGGGLLTQIVTEAFKLANVDVNYVAVPNNRAITGAMMGFYEGSYGWAHSAERDAKLLYSNKPIYALRIVFFQKGSNEIPWSNLTDLHPYRIGITQGNHYSDEFTALIESGRLQTDPAPSDLSNFRKLLVGRVDLFPIDQDVGQFILKTSFLPEDQTKISFQHKSISVVPVYVVIRRDLPQARALMERFDHGFQLLSDSGQLSRMIEAHRALLGQS